MDFCSRLKELRIENNYTQRELASLLSLSPNSVCEWEKGRCQPSIECIKKLSALFECSIDYLLGQSDDFGNITFQTDGIQLTVEEQQLLNDFRTLPRPERAQATEYIHYLADKRGIKNKHA